MLATLEPTLDLDATNRVLETYDPPAAVAWAARQFRTGLIMSSSFGAESALLLHMASEALPGIRVVFVDTGYLFPETHQFMEALRQRFDLTIWPYRTPNDPFVYRAQAGETAPSIRNNVEACCAANKNEPFERAMEQLKPKAWLRGIRRQQSDTRLNRQLIE